MGRGILTTEEIAELKLNHYVEDVRGSRIVYSDEFKQLFVREYFSGKKPRTIFREAGFNVNVLGSKRIERCSARWREANASGSLGEKFENNNFYEKNENEVIKLKRIISEQEKEIEMLRNQLRQAERA